MIRKHNQKLYKEVKGNRNEFYCRISELGGVHGEILVRKYARRPRN